MINKLPVNGPFWKAAVWVNYFNRSSSSWNDVTYFCTRYASLTSPQNRVTCYMNSCGLLDIGKYWHSWREIRRSWKRKQDVHNLVHLVEHEVSFRKRTTISASIPCSKYCAYHPTFQCRDWKSLQIRHWRFTYKYISSKASSSRVKKQLWLRTRCCDVRSMQECN